MDSFALKSCFIFSPVIKPNKAKPSDDEIQDAKLLIYYPSSEETLIKRSNIGIIEGTIDFIQTFTKSQQENEKKQKKNKLFFTELNCTYFISYKFEKEIYIVLLLEKSNLGFERFESMELKKKWLRNLIKNFYNIFYLFHGDIYSNFFPNGIDIRDDQIKYQNLIVKFSDFINSYFEHFSNMFTPFIDSVRYFRLEQSIESDLLEATLKLEEKSKEIVKTAICLNGRIIHNEINIDQMSLIYNMFFYIENCEDKREYFREPLLLGIDDDQDTLFSPFRKAFDIGDKKRDYLLGEKNDTIFIPKIHLRKTDQIFRLCVFKFDSLLFFFFLDNICEFKPILFRNISDYISNLFPKFINDIEKKFNVMKTQIANLDIHFVYYNEDNKGVYFSRFFFEKNTKILDKTKLILIQKIYEIIAKQSRSSITKLKNYFIYYYTIYEKKIAIILKDYKSLEEVQSEYLHRVLSIIAYL